MSRVASIEAIELAPVPSSSRQHEVHGHDSRSSSKQQFEQIDAVDLHGSGEDLNAGQTDPDNVQELAPIDRGWPAWRFVASGFAVEVMIWGFQFCYGIFQDYYASNPLFKDASGVIIAAVGTLSTAVQFGETILLSFFFGRYPDLLRPSLWAALALCVSSLLLASFATKIWHLILLQGITFGISGGFLYYPVLILLPQWFVHRRGLATGMIFAGSGLGGFAFPFLFQSLLENYGFRWTLRIWALAVLITIGFAVMGMQPRLPVPKYQRGQRPRFIPPQMHFLKSSLFWLLSACTVMHSMSYYSVSLYIVTFAKVISSPFSASVVLALFNSSSVVCQVILGHMCDRFPYAWIMVASTLVSGVSVFLLWGFTHTLGLLFAFAVVYGGLMGGYMSAGPISVCDCAGDKPEQASVIWACNYLVRGAAIVAGPLVSGILYDAGKASLDPGMRFGGYGFETLEIFVGSCAVAASFASALVALMSRRAQT
ncbi:MFS general substrate transporter [Daedalea quercina L-15889]|uniref:MFS general substrate transporter n=1 Tax=Daedalea quercina L-15889 TaxID=1314783 RepID=A0A165QDD4_9APHY|nr:MFS general substrate transporter [Daedalea quercina L-15889]